MSMAFIPGVGPAGISPRLELQQSSFTCTKSDRSSRCRSTVSRARLPGRVAVRALATTSEVTEDTFEAEVLQSSLPVVVDFYASWCGPCKLMTPLMDWAAAEYEGRVKLVKVDTEHHESFVKRYEIYGLPTFAVFVGGEARGVQEGAMSKTVFKAYIEKHAFSS